MIVRDEGGNVVGALCATVPFILDPAVDEVVALWRAVSFSSELALPRLQLEGDAKEIILALQHKEPCRSHYGPLIEATRSKLHDIPKWTVSHTRRDANGVAHRLAKVAVTQSLNFVWRDSYPLFIQRIVLVEQGHSFLFIE